MSLRLTVRVGQEVAIGGPTTLRIEAKSGQSVALVFDAGRSVPIRLIPETDTNPVSPKPQGEPVGLGTEKQVDPASVGLGRK